MQYFPRYLTYAPWQGQLNNTRLCFETALILAYISGRILVIPPGYRRRDEPEWDDAGFRPLHPGEFLDFDRLSSIVPMISYEEYAASGADGRQHDVIDIAVDAGTAVFCYPAIPAPGTAEALRLSAFAAGRGRFLQPTPELDACRTLNIQSPTLEPFYAFFHFSHPGHELECKRLVRDHVRFRPPVLEAGARIAAQLGNYSALHVRRGDFFWQRPEQDLSAERILHSMEAAGLRPSRLYIASDEMDRAYFAPISRCWETYFVEDFAGSLGDAMSAEDIACVEQVVCSHSDAFMGTRLSTFSSYITRLRGNRGAGGEAVLFTDGSPGSEADDEGSPWFSWTNWLRDGNPLWGREYREAWTF
jgi:hypothetical protein